MLVAIGVSTVYGLSFVPGDAGDFYAAIVARHAVFAAIGFLALVLGAVAERGLDRVRRYPFTMLAMAIALTVATVLFGETVNGARLWLDVGPVRFQPSEVARVLIAAFVAVFLYDRRHLLAAPWQMRFLDLPPAPYLIPLVGALFVAVGVLLFQNDLGMAALVALGAAATVVSVLRSRAAVSIAALSIATALAGAYVAVPRVRDRVVGWLDPWSDPAGRGFQFVQAEFSMSTGRLFGAGEALSAGTVPEVHTDLILVAVASRFGLPIAAAVLALAALLICRCMLAGLRARDGFRALAAVSLAALLAIQVVLISGGSLRVLPLTGLTFPLVSYGGTSMIVTQFAIGVIVGIGARPQNRASSGGIAETVSRRRSEAAPLWAEGGVRFERIVEPTAELPSGDRQSETQADWVGRRQEQG
jgi:cell division protein FtsW (lipid II flippase)